MSESQNKATATEYLVEIPEMEALQMISQSMIGQVEFSIKLEKSIQTYTAKIDKIGQGKIFFRPKTPLKESIEVQVGTIKFFVGTEVFFLKSQVEFLNGCFTIPHQTKIIQFKRRKFIRYVIPPKWNQTAALRSFETKFKLNAKVLDISLGGIRLEVTEPITTPIGKGEIYRIQFQIFKRGETLCDGEIKFIGPRPNGVTLIGLEFRNLSESHQSRIQSVIDDIINATTDRSDMA